MSFIEYIDLSYMTDIILQEQHCSICTVVQYSYLIYSCHGESVLYTGVCNDGEVQLVDGEAERGDLIVEMCYNGVWGTVCSDSWGEIETNVVCRQLGYNNSPSKFISHH